MYLCQRDLSKECEGKYRDCADCILDKIRVEVIQMPTISLNANDIYKADVLSIIKKYMVESEEKLDSNPVNIDKAVEHYGGTLKTLKGIDLEVDDG